MFVAPAYERKLLRRSVCRCKAGELYTGLLPHVNVPATVFVASNAGCPRELIRRVVCWRVFGWGFALRSGLGDGQGE
jgi:hypothetical protein